MKLTKEEIMKLIYCIDFVTENLGENKELEKIAKKLTNMITNHQK